MYCCLLDLPPAKRRKGITGSVISTAFSAALIGAAVGFTVYRMFVYNSFSNHKTNILIPYFTGGEIEGKNQNNLPLPLIKKNG